MKIFIFALLFVYLTNGSDMGSEAEIEDYVCEGCETEQDSYAACVVTALGEAKCDGLVEDAQLECLNDGVCKGAYDNFLACMARECDMDEPTLEVVLEGEFSDIVDKEAWLESCTEALSIETNQCDDVRDGSIVLTLSGESEEDLEAEAQNIETNGLEILGTTYNVAQEAEEEGEAEQEETETETEAETETETETEGETEGEGATECTETCPTGYSPVEGAGNLCILEGNVCGICGNTQATACAAVPSTTAEPTVATTPSPEAQAAAIALCSEFEQAGFDGVLFTDATRDEYPCATELKLSTEDERKAFHETHSPLTKPLWVFSSTDALSADLKSKLEDEMSYYTITSLGGLDSALADCSCRRIAVVDVESTEYNNEVAVSIVMAIVAVLLCIVLCFCLKKRKEYFPAETEEVVDTKQADVEAAGATTTETSNLDKKIFEEKWTTNAEPIMFERSKKSVEEAAI